MLKEAAEAEPGARSCFPVSNVTSAETFLCPHDFGWYIKRQ